MVVTIVVLLILAGISLNLVLGENGIITKAQEARDKTEQARINTEKSMNSLEQELSDYVNKIDSGNEENGSVDYDPAADGVTIPEGYYYVGGTKAKGIVISDNIADKELDKGKEDVRRDLAGNQWVWVPVEKPSDLYTSVTGGIAISGDTGVKTKKYTNSEIISGVKRVKPGDKSGIKEPELVYRSTGGSSGGSASGGSASGGSSSGSSSSKYLQEAETLVSEYDEMIESLERYHGFYIGRYELSKDGEKTGTVQTSSVWETFYENCKKLANGSKVKTQMIWGLQWDATCKWLENSGFSITNPVTWGNYNNNTVDGHGSPQNTGFSENWKANNIYDFAGNYAELTQEASGQQYRIARGGYYEYGDLFSSYALLLGSLSPIYMGTRPTLYLVQ